jgi:hypothetical protein
MLWIAEECYACPIPENWTENEDSQVIIDFSFFGVFFIRVVGIIRIMLLVKVIGIIPYTSALLLQLNFGV